MGYGFTVLAQGSRACFTRPEMKAERASYDAMTPSAARGLLESVYWKPAIKWVVDGITVNNEIRFDTFRRNELSGKASYRNAKIVMAGGGEVSQVATEERQQRATLYLKDVSYLIKAHFILTDKAGEDDTEEKHYNIALRRLRKGQCFNQGYLGCREFPADIVLAETEADKPQSFYAGTGERDLGFMLYDIDFDDDMSPMFYRAVMHDGFIDVAGARGAVIK